MEIISKDIETKCIHDMSAGDCFQRGGSFLMVTDKLSADSQERLCVNLNNGSTVFFNVWSDGILVKAKVVIGEE